jgi:SAM-dependent methyltransferase
LIATLKSWVEIGQATKSLARAGLPSHRTAEKNWDLHLLGSLVAPLDFSSRIVDLGCGDCFALKYLAATGFEDLLGIDLSITWRARAASLKRKLTGKRTFSLRRGDITRTGLAPQSVDLAISISTIEHGVPLAEFLSEASRILRPGGNLFVTTDYWPAKLNVPAGNVAFGLPWRPFDRDAVLAFVRSAGEYGLSLVGSGVDLDVSDPCVIWNGCEYTFIAIVLTKEN